MKKFRKVFALALLLTISLVMLAVAEDKTELFIDASRNAAFKFKSSESASGVNGTFNLGSDVTKGLMAGKVDMKFDAATTKQMGDSKGALYFNLGDVMEIVGNLNISLPPESKEQLKALTGTIESSLNGSSPYSKGKFNLEATQGGANVATLAVVLNGNGDPAKFDGTMKLNMDWAYLAQAQNPVRNFKIGISEKDATKSQIDLALSMDASSPYAAQMKQAATNPDQIKAGVSQALGSSGVKVEDVKLGEYKEADGKGSITLTIVLSDWRKVLQSAATSRGGADGNKMGAAVGKLLEARFDDVNLTLDFDKSKLDGAGVAKVGNVRQFLLGYYDIMSIVMDEQLKNQGDTNDFSKRMMLAYQSVVTQEGKRWVEVMADAGLGFKGDAKFNLSPAGDDKKGVKSDGEFNLTFDKFDSYIDKANVAHLPIGKNTALKVNVNMDASKVVKADLYGYTDGKVLDYYKQVLLDSAKKAGAPQPSLDEAAKVNFKDGQGSFTLTNTGITGSSFAETTDLGPLVKVLVDTAAKDQFSGQITGFSLNGATANNRMNVDGVVNFSKFMEGKSADEVKKLTHASTVNDKAKPEDVTLVAVTKPEVAMPAELKPIADDGKKLLNTSPMAAVTNALGGGKDGTNNLLYILGGLAAVGVVGVGLAASKKKN